MTRRSAGPTRLGRLDPEAHLRDPARRQHYVTTLFDTVAPSYDRFTRWFSFGMDRRWKRLAARWACEGLEPGDLVLDLACGTGDIAWAVERVSRGAIATVGVDLSREMLLRAGGRSHPHGPDGSTAQPPARLVRADMLALPARSGSVAVVTVGYGFRNVPDLPRSLREVARVLRPGGKLVSLDFFAPEGRRWRSMYLWYLHRAGRLAGWFWHGESEAYEYIARSLEVWLTPAGFSRSLEEAGFAVRRVKRHLGGGICLHEAALHRILLPS